MRGRKTRHKSKGRAIDRLTVKKRANNFYSVINKNWLDHLQIPDTETRITQAYFIREDINKELDALIATQVAAKEPNAIQTLMQSLEAVEEIPQGLSPLLHTVMSLSTPSDISARIGWMNRAGIPSPVDIYVQGDPHSQTRCLVFLEEGSPQIGPSFYWIERAYVKKRLAYERYCRKLAQIVGLPALAHGYTSEREIAHQYSTREEKSDARRSTNALSWSALCSTYTTIDWTRLFTSLGLPEERLKDLHYNVLSPSYIHHLQSRMRSWSTDRWAGWFGLLATQWAAGRVPAGPLRDAWFGYNYRFIQGMSADEPRPELHKAIIRLTLPATLGKLWVSKHYESCFRQKILAMIDIIREAAATCLETTEWMAPATRASAVKKLRSMEIFACWPSLSSWPAAMAEPTCGLSTNFLENSLFLASFRMDRNLAQLSKGVCGAKSIDNNEWARPVFEVNAFYYPDLNRFVMPAGILRAPFYDPKASLVTNYGAIGATIGHEFCHAFDAEGRTYDADGNQRDWWSKADDREYKRKAAAVVRLYESEDYRGMPVDGELTLVENIADIGGLEFALEGLQRALKRKITDAELREFFTSFAISWQSKDRLKRAAQLLDSDPHAPPMLRVNHAVRQFDEWYRAFDIQKEDPGFIEPAKRIHFFRKS
jgi:putative endopeptidase